MDPNIVVHATGDFRRLYGDLSKTEGRLSRVGRTAARGAAVGFGLAGAAVLKFGIDSTKSLARIERINAQTVAAIKSTGGAANVSAGHVDKMAHRIEDLTATEAESIQEGANFLLTFTNIRNEAGKNNKIFDQAVAAMTDMSRAMDKTGSAQLDTRTQALLLGKALNDPIKGLTALQRVGVAFTDGQKETIKTLVESGDTMQAQKIILRELTKEFGGSGEAFAKTTTGKIEIAKDALGDFGEEMVKGVLPAIELLAEKGTEGLEFLTDHADDIKEGFEDVRDAVAPAVDEVREALGHLTDEVAGSGDVFHDKFIPALETTAEVVGAVVNFVDELPGPVKNLGVEVGLAAIAFNLFNGYAGKARGALAGVTGAAATAETRMAALKTATRNVAGVGGMLLLSKGAQEADDSLGTLESIAGGALLGFSAGGPWGAAVGAGAGLLVDLATETENTADAMATSVPKIDSMTDSLDRLTGAITDQARVQALENARKRLEDFLKLEVGESNFGELTKQYGAFASVIEEIPDGSTIESLAARFGLSARQITQASLGQRDAVEAVSAAFRKHGRDSFDNVVAMRALRNIIGPVNKELKRNRAEVIRNAIATQDWSGKLKGFPDKAATRIDLKGVKPTETAIARLTLKYKDIDNKDIKTILGVTGVDATVKEIRRTADELKKADKKEARMNARIDGALNVRTEVEKTRGVLENLNGNEAHTYIYTHRVTVYEDRGSAPGGRDPGRVVPRGLEPLVGVEPLIEVLGRDVAAKAEKAGRNVIARLLRGILGGSSEVRSALDRLTSYIEKRINLKNDKKERAREKAVLKHLKDEYAALVNIGRQQDKLNHQLEEARQHLAEVRQFVDQVKQSFIDVGNVTQLGVLEDGSVSIDLGLDQLRDQVAQAQQFAALIQELTDDKGPKINQTTLEQLLAAGPAQGLAAAQALISGGAAAIDEWNDLTAQLGQSGQQLGAQMSDEMFDVGLGASIALVEGLEAQNAALDRAARRLARRLAEAVRKALGGKGKGGRGDHRQIAGALGGISLGQLGIDETTARTVGRHMLDGFRSAQIEAGAATIPIEATVRVKLTAEHQSQLARGKELTLTINAGQGRGVRRRAVTGG